MNDRPYTSKQMGDACEMLVAAELTFAGVPAMKVPDNWPCYDVVAQPPGDCKPHRISVKSRTFKRGSNTYVVYNVKDTFDWLAVVLLPGGGVDHRRIYIIPRKKADAMARKDSPTAKTANERYWPQEQVPILFAAFENNFRLLPKGSRQAET